MPLEQPMNASGRQALLPRNPVQLLVIQELSHHRTELVAHRLFSPRLLAIDPHLPFTAQISPHRVSRDPQIPSNLTNRQPFGVKPLTVSYLIHFEHSSSPSMGMSRFPLKLP